MEEGKEGVKEGMIRRKGRRERRGMEGGEGGKGGRWKEVRREGRRE